MALTIFSVIGIMVGLISLVFTIRDWNSKQIVDHEKRRWLNLITEILFLNIMLMLLIHEMIIFWVLMALNFIVTMMRIDASEKARQKASDMNGKIILFDQTDEKDSKKDEGDCSE